MNGLGLVEAAEPQHLSFLAAHVNSVLNCFYLTKI